MGQTTLNQIPWPEPTAPVRQGAAAMRAMAENLDGNRSGAAMHRIVDMNIANSTPTGVAWSGAINQPNVGGTVPAAATGITPGVAGVFAVHGTAHWASNNSGTRTLAILVNGTPLANDPGDARPAAGSTIRTINDIVRYARLAAGDLVNLQVTQTAGATLAVVYARLEVYRIA